MKRALAIAVCACALLAAPRVALPWGTTGHLEINLVAMRALPSDLPDFLQTAQAAATVEALGPEEDRLKGAGTSWDHDDDPAHYVDVGDDGSIAGTIHLHRMPGDMEAYARALAAAGTDPYKAGYLPYALADGWERLRKDFAYWRVFDYLARHGASASDRVADAAARTLRESLILRDVGVWGHFVGDASQPLHVTVHYNGWGKYPNPNHFTQAHIHARFEDAFVRDHVRLEAIAAAVPVGGPRSPEQLLSQNEILDAIGDYLEHTSAEVGPLYQIEKRGGFRKATPEAIAFATARLADGARQLRDFIVLAWDDSLYESVGYPEMPVRDILGGRITPPPSFASGFVRGMR